METFVEFVARETERLNRERDALMLQRSEIDGKLQELQRERDAISAYQSAKSGKAAKSTQPGTGRATRRGSKREELLAVIGRGDGLKRGDILEKMGLKNDKAGEMSVSNALTALVKNGQVVREDGKYRAAA